MMLRLWVTDCRMISQFGNICAWSTDRIGKLDDRLDVRLVSKDSGLIFLEGRSRAQYIFDISKVDFIPLEALA